MHSACRQPAIIPTAIHTEGRHTSFLNTQVTPGLQRCQSDHCPWPCPLSLVDWYNLHFHASISPLPNAQCPSPAGSPVGGSNSHFVESMPNMPAAVSRARTIGDTTTSCTPAVGCMLHEDSAEGSTGTCVGVGVLAGVAREGEGRWKHKQQSWPHWPACTKQARPYPSR